MCGFIISQKGFIPSILKGKSHIPWIIGELGMVKIERF
jgi:hypothetical protein